MLSIRQKKTTAVVVKCCVNNAKEIIKPVFKFSWNTEFMISYQRKEIEKYSYEVELKI